MRTFSNLNQGENKMLKKIHQKILRSELKLTKTLIGMHRALLNIFAWIFLVAPMLACLICTPIGCYSQFGGVGIPIGILVGLICAVIVGLFIFLMEAILIPPYSLMFEVLYNKYRGKPSTR